MDIEMAVKNDRRFDAKDVVRRVGHDMPISCRLL